MIGDPKSKVGKTLAQINPELLAKLFYDLQDRAQHQERPSWTGTKEPPRQATSLDLMANMATKSETRVVDLLAYAIVPHHRLKFDKELFVGLCHELGIQDYPYAFERYEVMEFADADDESERIIWLVEQLGTCYTSGWDRLTDTEFMNAFLNCLPTGKDGRHFRYRVKLDRESGLEVDMTMISHYGSLAVRYIAEENGWLLRQARSEHVHLPLADPDVEVDKNTIEQYREQAKRMMIQAGRAEWAALPHNKRLVARELMEHPWVLATTDPDYHGGRALTKDDAEQTYVENIPV